MALPAHKNSDDNFEFDFGADASASKPDAVPAPTVLKKEPTDVPAAEVKITVSGSDDFASETILKKKEVAPLVDDHLKAPPVQHEAKDHPSPQPVFTASSPPSSEADKSPRQKVPPVKDETKIHKAETLSSSAGRSGDAVAPSAKPAEQPKTPIRDMATTNPPLSSFTKNVERQKKEQATMTTLLSGVGLFLLVLIILFGGSAAFGAYVFYKELGNQKVTLSQLDSKYSDAFVAQEEKTQKLSDDITALEIINKNQREEIINLRAQINALARQNALADRRAAELQARLDRIEGRTRSAR